MEGSKALYNEEKLKQEIVKEVARTHTYKIVFWISICFLLIVSTLLILLYRKFHQLSVSRSIIVRNDKDYFRPQPTSIEMADDTTTKQEDENTRIFNKVSAIVKDNDEVYDEEFNTGRLAELVGRNRERYRQPYWL